MPNKVELKPCPFCGNTKSVECVNENNRYGDNYYYVGWRPINKEAERALKERENNG